MRKMIGNIGIYLLVCGVILVSFKLPEELFKMQESEVEMVVYRKEEAKNNLAIEVEDIYLVKAIHDRERKNVIVEVGSSDSREKVMIAESFSQEGENDIEKEMLKLKEYDIINQFEVGQSFSVGVIHKSYQSDNLRYRINRVSLNVHNSNYEMEMESKTGKILSILIEKGNLNTQIEREELMRNYIQYLDLYIIDDWVFENNMMKSEKAKLFVSLIENNEKYTLSIHSSSEMSTNLEYVYVG